MFSADIKGEHFWQTVPGVFYWNRTGNGGRPYGLMSFDDIDECITWLYMYDDKELARALNAKKKEWENA
jgi:hypothetical protein